jgi:DNA repair exonuclease SbcCD ATPase subunit
MSIRYLDISELNDRLQELESLRDDETSAKGALADAKTEVDDAQNELDSHVSPTDGIDDVDLDEREDTLAKAEDSLFEAKAAHDHAVKNFTAEERKELDELESLKSDIGESRGKISEDGGPFIHSDDFTEYAEEFANECCEMPKNRHGSVPWPFTCIDWEQAAKELAYDYSTVTYDGTDYMYRS